jgi:hypothetical protein
MKKLNADYLIHLIVCINKEFYKKGDKACEKCPRYHKCCQLHQIAGVVYERKDDT